MGAGAACIDPIPGIGGIVFTANHPQALQAWYKRHLGIDVRDWGGAAFPWTDADGKLVGGKPAWSIMPAEGDPFAPGTTSVMVNDRVADLQALRKPLREEACSVLDKSGDAERTSLPPSPPKIPPPKLSISPHPSRLLTVTPLVTHEHPSGNGGIQMSGPKTMGGESR